MRRRQVYAAKAAEEQSKAAFSIAASPEPAVVLMAPPLPADDDYKAEGDRHIQGIKAVLKATFPNVSSVPSVAKKPGRPLGSRNKTRK